MIIPLVSCIYILSYRGEEKKCGPDDCIDFPDSQKYYIYHIKEKKNDMRFHKTIFLFLYHGLFKAFFLT